jgi:hypothetical protein
LLFLYRFDEVIQEVNLLRRLVIPGMRRAVEMTA